MEILFTDSIHKLSYQVNKRYTVGKGTFSEEFKSY